MTPKRDFVFVDDVVSALRKIIEQQPRSSLVNIGSGSEYSISTIIKQIEDLTSTKFNIESDKSKLRQIERQHLLSNINKINHLIGFQPKYDLRSGLRLLLKKEGLV